MEGDHNVDATASTRKDYLRLVRKSGSELRLVTYRNKSGKRLVRLQVYKLVDGRLIMNQDTNLAMCELAPLACALIRLACEGDIGGPRWKDSES